MTLPLSEADVQRVVTDAAELLGWTWCHFRPSMTRHGWRTPVQGPLGQGWPDLFMVRDRDRRVLLVECKGPNGRLSPEQHAVHDRLRSAGLDVRIVRPVDIDHFIERCLR